MCAERAVFGTCHPGLGANHCAETLKPEAGWCVVDTPQNSLTEEENKKRVDLASETL